MNKFLLHIFFLSLIYPITSFSEEVTININASVVERSCTISSESLNSTIRLPIGNLREKKVGEAFGGKSFSISLIDCPNNISSAHITFTGEGDSTMGNFLRNIDETNSAATGIALGLYDTDNNNIDIRNNKQTLTVDHSLNKNTFDFLAYYVKVNNSPTGGKVISVADFELSYD